MAIYGSGSIRFSGLGSDTNFDEMIEKLYKIESRQVNQLIKWRGDWDTRMEAFKQLRGELMNMQSALTKLNSMTKFMAKTAASSDEKVATAVPEAESLDGAYHVKTKQLAKAYTWSQNTGLYNKSDVICSAAGGGTFEYTYKGKTRTIQVPKNTTAEGLVKLINNDSKNPGARAQLIQSADGITFQMYGKETGESNTLVIRKTDNLSMTTTLSATTYNEQENQFQLLQGFDTSVSGYPSVSINNTGDTKNFKYTVDGTAYTVPVPAGMKLDELITEINNRTPGVASMSATKWDGSTATNTEWFTLKRVDTTYNFTGDANYNTYVNNPSTTWDSTESVIYTGPPQNAKLTVVIGNSDDGTTETKEITVTDGMKLHELKTAVEQALGDKATVGLKTSGGKFYIDVQQKNKTHQVTVENGTLPDFAYKIPDANSEWSVVEGQNALVKVNGWPGGDDDTIWFESASNTIKAGEIVDGIGFNLLKIGETTITTGTDKEKIRENIEGFVDAVNAFRVLYNELTKVDSEKKTYSPDLAESQFEMQKGAVLTGNYGVQLVGSQLKNAIASSGTGFRPREYGSDGSFLGGDIFSSLSQIGITTNAEQGSTFFGLLEINYISGSKGSKTLDEALNEDPMAVARLFAAKNEGTTDSTDFSFNSSLGATTKAGNYSVWYICDAAGNIVDAKINGQQANFNKDTMQLTSMEGPSQGLVVDIYPHSLAPNAEVNGTVSLREGKVNELLTMLGGTEGMLGSSGALRTLERNYQKIMDGIDKKISREDERLAKWERTMINKFARLDAVLANYNAINEGLKSQIASLGTKS